MQLRFLVLFGLCTIPTLCFGEKAPYNLQIGCPISAYSMARSVVGVQFLSVSEAEQKEISISREIFRSLYSPELRETRSQFQSDWKPETYLEWLKKSKFSRESCDYVFEDLDKIITEPSRQKTLRELFMQRALRQHDLDAIIILHKLDISLEKYENFYELVKESPPEQNPKYRIEACMDLLVENELLTEEELKAACGERVTISGKSKGYIGGYARYAGRYYQDAPMRYLQKGTVQAELSVSIKKLDEIRRMIKFVLDRQSEARAQQIMLSSTSAKAREISALIERWREEQWKHVGNVLEEDQVVRLKQILFQHHCSRVQIPWALYMAGKPFDPDNRDHAMIANDIQEMANYRWQAERLSTAFDALAKTTGKSKARRICGDLTVIPYIFSPEEFDAEYYRRINDRLFKNGESPSPRREGNSHRRDAQ